MSVTVNVDRSRQVFLEALALVDSGASLPEEWIERVRSLGRSPNRTFMAMLGTALLSRAADPRVDPLVLKSGAEPSPGFESYSARAVATAVLAPMAVEHSVNIGTRGREPLNNQPFFRYGRVHLEMVVRSNAKAHLMELVEALERLRELEESELLPALAAFIAVRRAAVRRPTRRAQVVSTAWSLSEFVAAVSTFVTDWPEDGKRGQALVAAALDLAFAQVRLGHVNDPGRRIPGDVYAYGELDASALPLPVEVKQRAASHSEVLRWAAELSRVGVRRGLYVLLAPGQPDLGAVELSRRALADNGVVLTLFESAEAFLQASITWSNLDPESFMGAFAATMESRLEEAGVTPETVESWVDLFQNE